MKQLSRFVQAMAATKRKGMKRLKLRIEDYYFKYKKRRLRFLKDNDPKAVFRVFSLITADYYCVILATSDESDTTALPYWSILAFIAPGLQAS
jgi:hypothetical protein